LKSEGIINPKLLFKNKKQVPNDISNIDYFIIENNNLDKYANFLFDLRKEKGLQIEEAKEMVKEPNYLATLMVKMNEADCEICGIEYPTMDTYKPALQIIKTNPVLSPIACSIMILNKKNKKYIFADISLNLDPNANELSSIAKLTALFANNVLNFKNNKIAMLSYSSEGSGKGISVDKVKTAAKILKSDIDMKKFNISNDIQFDAAFCPEINKKKIPYLK
jgi:phosphate acetyltransferase